MKFVFVIILTIYHNIISAQDSKSIIFDGESYAITSNTKVLNTFPVSIEAWVKPYLREDASFFPTNVISNDNPGRYGIGFGLNTSKGFGLLTYEYHNGFRNVGYETFESDKWYHITIVYDYDKILTYINGILSDSLYLPSKIEPDGLENISFGRHNTDTGYGTVNFFRGELDEIRIWNKILTQKDILKNFHKLNGDEKGLTLYFPVENETEEYINEKVKNINAKFYGKFQLSDYGAPVGNPLIQISEKEINFDKVYLNETKQFVLNVKNIGRGILVYNPKLIPGLISIEVKGSKSLMPGDSSQIIITLNPNEKGSLKQELFIESNSESSERINKILIKANITQIFWETIWFKLIVAFFFLTIGPLFYYMRVKVLKRKALIQENFSRKLLETEENERKRIAGEIHDSLSQNILLIKNRALLAIENKSDSIEQLKEITSIAGDTLEDARKITHNLRPIQLDRLGLTETLNHLIKNIINASTINIEYEINQIDNLINKNSEIIVFRILQELMNNIIKHSNATEVTIIVSVEEENLHIFVQDNGVGFDYEKYINNEKMKFGLGLSSIIERVKILSGKYKIKSEINKGTTIVILIPINIK